MKDKDIAVRITEIVYEISVEHLQGIGPDMQSAVLCDLMAMWLAGHIAADLDEKALQDCDTMRHELFEAWARTMWSLVLVNENILRERYGLPPRPQKGEDDASKRN